MAESTEKPNFESLWRALEPHVRAAVSRHRSRDVALASDDLVQEVRIRVWQTYESDRKRKFNTFYYYRVVNSAIIDALRRYRGTFAHGVQSDDETALDDPGDVENPNPESQLLDEERASELSDAIAQLPESRARAVKLFLQGFSIPEIAELFDCDETRAHNLTYRGIRALKKTMGDE